MDLWHHVLMRIIKNENQYHLENHEQQILDLQGPYMAAGEEAAIWDELVGIHARLDEFDFKACPADQVRDMRVKIELDKSSLYSIASGLLTASMAEIEAYANGGTLDS
jgi:hypothetical protein